MRIESGDRVIFSIRELAPAAVVYALYGRGFEPVLSFPGDALPSHHYSGEVSVYIPEWAIGFFVTRLGRVTYWARDGSRHLEWAPGETVSDPTMARIVEYLGYLGGGYVRAGA